MRLLDPLLGIKAAIGPKHYHLAAFITFCVTELQLPDKVPIKNNATQNATTKGRKLSAATVPKSPTKLWDEFLSTVFYIKWGHLILWILLMAKKEVKAAGWYDFATILCKYLHHST